MTPRQRRFVAEYLVDLNAVKAAARAGYTPATARAHASRLRWHPQVAAAIAGAMAERETRTAISADRVLREIARIAFADIRRFAEWGEDGIVLKPLANISGDDAAAIAELSPTRKGSPPKLKLHDKKSALDMLARHLGLLGRPGQDPAPAGDAADPDAVRAELARRIALLAAPKGTA